MENAEMKIEIDRLYNGEYIIGEVDNNAEKPEDTEIIMKNPRLLFMVPSQTGSMSVAVKHVCFPFTSKRLKDELVINKSQVMFRLFDELGEIEKEIVDGYKSEITGIKIATAAETASIGAGTGHSTGSIII